MSCNGNQLRTALILWADSQVSLGMRTHFPIEGILFPFYSAKYLGFGGHRNWVNLKSWLPTKPIGAMGARHRWKGPSLSWSWPKYPQSKLCTFLPWIIKPGNLAWGTHGSQSGLKERQGSGYSCSSGKASTTTLKAGTAGHAWTWVEPNSLKAISTKLMGIRVYFEDMEGVLCDEELRQLTVNESFHTAVGLANTLGIP